MKINIKATNTTLTPSIKNFIEEKLSSLEKFLKPEYKLHVELEIDKKHKTGDVFRTEINILPSKFYAEGFAPDFYAAFDIALPKIKEQLMKAKDKQLTRRKVAARSASRLKRGM